MTRLLVCSAIRLYRDGLAGLIALEKNVEVVGMASYREDVIRLASLLEPDLILLDMAMPESLAAVRELRAATPEQRILALGVRESDDEVLAAAEAGVCGFVTRAQAVDELLASIETVMHGEALCSPRVAATLLRRVTALAADQGITSGNVKLTNRELEVVGLIDRGYTNKQIAQQLSIELPTVKNHVHSILDKLNVGRRHEALARLRAQGMVFGGN